MIRLTTGHQLQRRLWPEQRSEIELWLKSRGQGQHPTALRADNEEDCSGRNLTYLSLLKRTPLWAESPKVTNSTLHSSWAAFRK